MSKDEKNINEYDPGKWQLIEEKMKALAPGKFEKFMNTVTDLYSRDLSGNVFKVDDRVRSLLIEHKKTGLAFTDKGLEKFDGMLFRDIRLIIGLVVTGGGSFVKAHIAAKIYENVIDGVYHAPKKTDEVIDKDIDKKAQTKKKKNKRILASPGAVGASFAGADKFQFIATSIIMASHLLGKDVANIEVSDDKLREYLERWELEPSDESIQKVRNYLTGKEEI